MKTNKIYNIYIDFNIHSASWYYLILLGLCRLIYLFLYEPPQDRSMDYNPDICSHRVLSNWAVAALIISDIYDLPNSTAFSVTHSHPLSQRARARARAHTHTHIHTRIKNVEYSYKLFATWGFSHL